MVVLLVRWFLLIFIWFLPKKKSFYYLSGGCFKCTALQGILDRYNSLLAWQEGSEISVKIKIILGPNFKCTTLNKCRNDDKSSPSSWTLVESFFREMLPLFFNNMSWINSQVVNKRIVKVCIVENSDAMKFPTILPH